MEPLVEAMEEGVPKDQTVGGMIREIDTIGGDLAMSEYLEKMVILDLIYGSFIHDNFMVLDRFPFPKMKSMKGSEIGDYYLKNLWHHYRALYVEKIRNHDQLYRLNRDGQVETVEK